MRPAASGVALSEVLGALSYALDITEGEPPGHAVRSLAIGMRLAEELRLGDADRSALFYALLLKDVGCSANASYVNGLLAGDDRIAKRDLRRIDWTRLGPLTSYAWQHTAPGGSLLNRTWRMRRLVRRHHVAQELAGLRCEQGARIAHMLELPGATAGAIRALDEHWDGSGSPRGLRGEEIPLLARIMGLAQTVEVFLREGSAAEALEMALARRGRWFDPALVDALVRVRDDREFWTPLADPRAVPALAVWEPADRVLVADERRLDRVAEAFAQVIDAKSPYTARHSEGVARYAVAIATELEMAPLDVRDLRRAGLLHDIGKLAVSSSVLDKPGRLEPHELAQIRTHPHWTERILERVACFRTITPVAAAHHERLDGTGYHRGRPGSELTRPMRVLAVADVYEALTAERPYRAALPREEALGILAAQRGDALCPESLDALERALAHEPQVPVAPTA
jgi:putative nucleotidyltransferase with HDIG domain